MQNIDMFDICGANKLSDFAVEARAGLVNDYATSRDAVFFCSHSGGKDSQAMYIEMCKRLPKEQIVVIHVHLGKYEHHGVIEHIESTIDHELVVLHPNRDLGDAILLKGMFPSARQRWCTSDLKNNTIQKFIRRYMNENKLKVGFNCVGLRSEESPGRAKKSPLFVNTKLNAPTKKREVYDWYPVFAHNVTEVFDTIEDAGQQAHPMYGDRGDKNERLSCALCILANKNDLTNGVVERPELYTDYIAIERVINHTMFVKQKNKQPVPVSISEKTGVPFDEVEVQRKMPIMQARRDALLAQKEAEALAKQSAKTERDKAKRAKRTCKKRDLDTVDMFSNTSEREVA
ncbi:phosphoadenosine phosphosulfate reductase domain-containing protein [Salinimonas chungwhensis]|uniref:phosphoadenosine phosphosulfate reductase domain-containing protein n=1 Tax=Salinimonas chungwhensis TaxID=265425 RepID=UPI00035C5350|nr:phosphoadenosine phosphosulfate reductase family protein [Salinimonas chungwhensis]